MTRYTMDAETGEYVVTVPSANLSVLGSTANVAVETLRSPTETTVILPPGQIIPSQIPAQITGIPRSQKERDYRKEPGAIVLSPRFKLIFIAVLAITILAGLAEIVMASIWISPTGLQQSVFSAMDFAWKAGLGA